MTGAQKKRFYVLFALAVLLSLVIGLVVGYHSRSATICPDGKAPLQEDDQGPLGNVLFKCPDGTIVTTG
jgi:hypothetical protein